VTVGRDGKERAPDKLRTDVVIARARATNEVSDPVILFF